MHFLKPIYKKGKVRDPDNYRGLAIGPTLAKLYSLILLKRLTTFIKDKNIMSPNQIGFMSGSCTSDHIFLLQTAIEKTVKKGKNKLYAAFIDFKKAYDTVDRDILLQRLKRLGINGTFWHNIAAMYRKTDYAIKLNGKTLDAISSNLGLKQGCPLSPMLFNLYMDDVNDIFDDLCEPIDIQAHKINHFMYADDLVLLSRSREGLQRCLDKLHHFSSRKHLTISIKKSKTMTFNPAGRLLKDTFTLGNNTLEPVQTFCYLGFDVTASGTVTHAMNILNDKANKALRPLMCAIARFNIPVKTAIRLFHTYISPIILYNAENWATLTEKNLRTFDSNTIFMGLKGSKTDILHRKLLKFVLGVSKSSPNLVIYGDTGEIPQFLGTDHLHFSPRGGKDCAGA